MSSINWYPGHMHKARKAMLKTLNKMDVLIEIVDARLPTVAKTPSSKTGAKKKPTIVILNKNDLADPQKTHLWHTTS